MASLGCHARDRELAEIDENLIRNELTALERAEAYARRKELHEAKHPETKHGGTPGAGRGKKKRSQKEPTVGSFSDETAKKTGKSKSTIKTEVQIGEGLDDKAKKLIRGTDVADSQKDLLALAKMSVEDQRRIAKMIADGDAKSVREARGIEARAKDAERAKGAWAASQTQSARNDRGEASDRDRARRARRHRGRGRW